ncbi:hypothetical protein H5085_05710 [Pseudoalteromonas sp. SR43-6]|nr:MULTISPECIES: hypothetical protein [unclassified Pseudoalteromonas]MBB1290164.1 hypothetical protein [Pseudoalteromonas sp. SR41-5]MBB1373813.1 hypothetical protein [Pseudoalteromonas sp. SR43-6]MBB1412864.1 hypothetical protein [Pseudoalteromonas sp. SG43-8]
MLTQFNEYVKAALLVRQQARRLHGHKHQENPRRYAIPYKDQTIAIYSL